MKFETRELPEAIPAVRLAAAGKAYGRGRKAVTALAGLDLEVVAGRTVAIIGTPGSGRSTLLRLIAGLEPPTTGSVEVFGRTARAAAGEQDLGIVAEPSRLRRGLTVRKNLAGPLRRAGLPFAEAALRVDELVVRHGLGNRAEQRVRRLGPVDRLHASLAMALALRPRLLLLDEPFLGLDAFSREREQGVLRAALLGSGLTVVIATDSVDESVFLADEVAVLRPGDGGTELRLVRVPFGEQRPEGLRERPEFFDRVVAVRAALHGDPVPDDGD